VFRFYLLFVLLETLDGFAKDRPRSLGDFAHNLLTLAVRAG
jgi:hypothetical protein